MTCRTCKHLDVKPDPSGRIVPRQHRVYPCGAIVGEPHLPASMLKSYGFVWPPARSYMQPDEGEGCTFYEKRQ